MSALGATAVVLLSASCAPADDDAASEAAATAAGSYALLGIDHAPRRVVFPVQRNDRGFAARLYGIVREINEAEHLHGESGANAAISLVGHISRAEQLDDTGTGLVDARKALSEVEARIRASAGIPSGAAIPNLQIVQTNGDKNDAVFMQDLFEVLAEKTANGSSLAMLDLTTRSEGADHDIVKAPQFRAGVGAVATPSGVQIQSDDDDGGNLEVTHEGRPYVGDTTSLQLRDTVKRLTGQAPIVLPTSWLNVGHVDEYVTFLPSTDECGGALVYADPLEALSIIRKRSDAPLFPREDLDDSGVVTRDKEQNTRELLESLRHFVRPSAQGKDALRIEDFDLTKKPRDQGTISNLDVEVLGNLHAHVEIQKAVESLQKSSRCLKQVVGVPSLFALWAGPSGDPSMAEMEIETGYAAVSGYLNLVVLRNHVIIAKEREDFFGPIVRERLAAVLGSPSRVHEIDATFFEEHEGSVHCATNVVRLPDRWRRSLATPGNAASSCPQGCVASNFCKEKVTSPSALRVNGLPCVINGAPGCRVCE